MSDLIGKYIVFDLPLYGPEIFKVEGHVHGTLFYGKFVDTETGYVFFDMDKNAIEMASGIYDQWEFASKEKAELIQHKKLKGN